jgi:membrane associated rhomboid family serine protease
MNSENQPKIAEKSLEAEGRELLESLVRPAIVVFILWAIYGICTVLHIEMGSFGIYPRRIFGLPGILTGPLVHGSLTHLASNSVPLFVLLTILMYFYKKVAVPAFVMLYFLTNIAVWLLARDVYHIGVSGVIYGLVAFVFWNGLFRGSVRSIVLALGVLIFYSGMFQGILPDQEGISWESHLLGSLVGIFTSYWFRGELEEDEAEFSPFQHEKVEKTVFLPVDIFEKTKAERAEEARLRAELLEKQRLEALERARLENEQRPPDFWTSTWS